MVTKEWLLVLTHEFCNIKLVEDSKMITRSTILEVSVFDFLIFNR